MLNIYQSYGLQLNYFRNAAIMGMRLTVMIVWLKSQQFI